MTTSLGTEGVQRELHTVSRAEIRPQLPKSVVRTEIKELQVELQETLQTLQQDPVNLPDDEKMDEEKANMDELLKRGQELLQQTSEEEQREELQVMLLRLQSQYSAHRELKMRRFMQMEGPSSSHFEERTLEVSAQEMSAAGLSSSLSLTPSDYLLEINKVLLGMADNELLLNSSELSGGLYEDFPSQEDTLKVTAIHERQPDAIQEASHTEAAQIGDALAQLDAEWDRLNRMYSQRKGSFDRAVEEWGRFHCDLKEFSQWLTDAETLLSEGPDGQLDLESARQQQAELEDGLASHQAVLSGLNRTGKQIIGNLSSPDGSLLEDKLETVGQRWRAVQQRLSDRQRRLPGGDPALADLVRRREALAVWLEQAENAVASLPVSATDRNLKELKALAEEMDAQNEQLGWVNKHASQILASPRFEPSNQRAAFGKTAIHQSEVERGDQ
ncbi:Utrophin [Oryzias melastigma]|uniref:Utrophin n=1 Tax=Oryzias melastigma TaxID=30732 RepID=A0A834CK33_ORYME|nr:Utrophin [Oryzias melastigma]